MLLPNKARIPSDIGKSMFIIFFRSPFIADPKYSQPEKKTTGRERIKFRVTKKVFKNESVTLIPRYSGNEKSITLRKQKPATPILR